MTMLHTHATVAAAPGLDASGQIAVRLRRVWRRRRTADHVRGVCLVLIWTLAMLLLDLTIDWLFLLPGYARLLLLAVNIAAIGRVAYRRWWRVLQPYDPVRIALQVERDHPQLQSLLVSYVQLGEEGGPALASPQLVAAMRRQAVEQARPIDFAGVVSLRDLRRLALFCAACLIVFGAMSVNWPNVLRTLLLRMLNPTAQVAYPTRTRIDSFSGDVVVRQGDPIALSARVSGLAPMQAELLVRGDDGRRWDRIRLDQDEQATYTHTVERSVDSFEYQMRIGDAVTPVHRVLVVAPPGVRDATVRVEPPAYTGLDAFDAATLNFTAPQDARVQWRITLDRPIRHAELRPHTGEAIVMTLDSAGLVAEAQVNAQTAWTYELHWTDRQHGYTYADGVRYAMSLAPDQPPQVALQRPQQDALATRQVRLPIVYQAQDDYGLGDVAIVYQHNEGPEQRVPLPPAPRGNRTHSGELTWPLGRDIPALREGDSVAFAIEVADNRTGEGRRPNVGRSLFRRISIVSQAQYESHIAARQQELMDMLEGLRREEEAAGEQVEGLIEQAPVLQE